MKLLSHTVSFAQLPQMTASTPLDRESAREIEVHWHFGNHFSVSGCEANHQQMAKELNCNRGKMLT
jgi:hypothetical protein